MSNQELPEYVVLMPPNEDRDYSLIALGAVDHFRVQDADFSCWASLDAWISKHRTWIFGFISYDAKNGIEKLTSANETHIPVPDIHFFVPACVAILKDGHTKIIHGHWNGSLDDLFERHTIEESFDISPQPVQSKAEYLESVNALLHHIHRGDIYEVNYCQQFHAAAKLNCSLNIFRKLYGITEAPHSVYLRMNHLHVMCGSPERYLSRTGNSVQSQPIKGTMRRGKDEVEDAFLKNALRNSQKEISENVMIVDLVRNDLSKSARRGSVLVEELCGVKSFKTVHHLVSNIKSEVHQETGFSQLIRDTFPMGSMTGAPKVRAMELIEQYERTRRGLYSGTIGFISPEGNFDFNVVIRSLIYDELMHKILFSVGGAITARCSPEDEYMECLLKAEAMMKALA